MVITGEMGIWNPSPGGPPVSSCVHKCVEEWLGCATAGTNQSRDMDRGRTRSQYQHLGDESSSTGFECRLGPDHGSPCLYKCYSGGIPIHKEMGTGDSHLGRAVLSQHIVQPGEEHSCWPARFF